MPYKYEVSFKFRARDFFAHIRKIEDSVNESMESFGFSEKMFLESESPLTNLLVGRMLTDEEVMVFINAYNKALEGKDMTCTGIEFKGWEATKDCEDEGVDAYQEAYDSYPHSESWENPYKKGTEAHNKWAEGWSMGHAHGGP